MTKTYNTPMLQVVSINKNDIIVTSLGVDTNAYNNVSGDAPGMRMMDDWDAGY